MKSGTGTPIPEKFYIVQNEDSSYCNLQLTGNSFAVSLQGF